MGKIDFLTPKAIANQIKAKGLQKLRWYCQMCQKQCRDENGFKCHCMSESHQRQMQVFGQNPTRVVDGYSEEFEQTFLDLMRRSHRFSRIAATVVYNEYINDRHHVHMNSTEWATLTEFIKYLGKTGKCKVEETPKGWFITYIDRDSETLFKERLKNKRVKSDLAEEEKQEREIQKQIERAAEKLNAGGGEGESSGKEVVEEYDDKKKKEEELRLKSGVKVGFALGGGVKQVTTGKERVVSSKLVFGDEENEKVQRGEKRKRSGDSGRSKTDKRSALDELMKEEEKKKKERMNRKDYWLFEGIIVKVMSKGLAEKGYYKQKGVVKKVVDKYVGEIEMLDSKHVLRVDQVELETVLPQIGGIVKIVNGAYRRSNARLLGLDTEKFCAKVQIEKSVYDGRVIRSIAYEVTFHYIGYNESGRRIDSTYIQGSPARIRMGTNALVPGFEMGIRDMKPGGRRRIIIPPELGPPVGPSTFFSSKQFEVFDVELLSIQNCERRTIIGFYSDVTCS